MPSTPYGTFGQIASLLGKAKATTPKKKSSSWIDDIYDTPSWIDDLYASYGYGGADDDTTTPALSPLDQVGPAATIDQIGYTPQPERLSIDEAITQSLGLTDSDDDQTLLAQIKKTLRSPIDLKGMTGDGTTDPASVRVTQPPPPAMLPPRLGQAPPPPDDAFGFTAPATINQPSPFAPPQAPPAARLGQPPPPPPDLAFGVAGPETIYQPSQPPPPRPPVMQAQGFTNPASVRVTQPPAPPPPAFGPPGAPPSLAPPSAPPPSFAAPPAPPTAPPPSRPAAPFQLQPKTATIGPSTDEQQFQQWYAAQAQQHGLNPNPDAPEQHYDYRAAFKAGVTPDETGHWPSAFKTETHPNVVVGGFDTRTGARVSGTKQASEKELVKLGWPKEDAARLTRGEPLDSPLDTVGPAANLERLKIGSAPLNPQTPADAYTAETLNARVARVQQRMAEAGYPVIVTSRQRTEAEQNKLYAQGRSTPGRIVTKADGTRVKSNHQTGTAADLAFVVKGKASWAETLPWPMLGRIAREEGLQWGGDWQDKQLNDRTHVQLPPPADTPAPAVVAALAPPPSRPAVPKPDESFGEAEMGAILHVAGSTWNRLVPPAWEFAKTQGPAFHAAMQNPASQFGDAVLTGVTELLAGAGAVISAGGGAIGETAFDKPLPGHEPEPDSVLGRLWAHSKMILTGRAGEVAPMNVPGAVLNPPGSATSSGRLRSPEEMVALEVGRRGLDMLAKMATDPVFVATFFLGGETAAVRAARGAAAPLIETPAALSSGPAKAAAQILGAAFTYDGMKAAAKAATDPNGTPVDVALAALNAGALAAPALFHWMRGREGKAATARVLDEVSTARTKSALDALGVSPEDARDPEALKRAYKAAARASHPDFHPDDPTATDRFRAVNEGYEWLAANPPTGVSRKTWRQHFDDAMNTVRDWFRRGPDEGAPEPPPPPPPGPTEPPPTGGWRLGGEAEEPPAGPQPPRPPAGPPPPPAGGEAVGPHPPAVVRALTDLGLTAEHIAQLTPEQVQSVLRGGPIPARAPRATPTRDENVVDASGRPLGGYTSGEPPPEAPAPEPRRPPGPPPPPAAPPAAPSSSADIAAQIRAEMEATAREQETPAAPTRPEAQQLGGALQTLLATATHYRPYSAPGNPNPEKFQPFKAPFNMRGVTVQRITETAPGEHHVEYTRAEVDKAGHVIPGGIVTQESMDLRTPTPKKEALPPAATTQSLAEQIRAEMEAEAAGGAPPKTTPPVSKPAESQVTTKDDQHPDHYKDYTAEELAADFEAWDLSTAADKEGAKRQQGRLDAINEQLRRRGLAPIERYQSRLNRYMQAYREHLASPDTTPVPVPQAFALDDEAGKTLRGRVDKEQKQRQPAVSGQPAKGPRTRVTLEQGPFRGKIEFNDSKTNPLYRGVVTREGKRVAEYETVDQDDAETWLDKAFADRVEQWNASPRVTESPTKHPTLKGYLGALGYDNVTAHNNGTLTIRLTDKGNRLVLRTAKNPDGSLRLIAHNKTQAARPVFKQLVADLAQYHRGYPAARVTGPIADSRAAAEPPAPPVEAPAPPVEPAELPAQTGPNGQPLTTDPREPWQMTRREFYSDTRAYLVPKGSFLNTKPEDIISGKALEGKTVAFLKEVATVYHVPISGSKERLIQRIRDAAQMRANLADETQASLRAKPKVVLSGWLKTVTGSTHSQYGKVGQAYSLLKWRDTARRKGKEAIANDNHHRHVRAALEAGKPVPDAVLKDYPDLAKEFNYGPVDTTTPEVPDSTGEGPGPRGAGAADGGPGEGGGPPVDSGAPRPPKVRPDVLTRRADQFWTDYVLPDARSHGYAGTDADLRTLYDDRVASARSLLQEMQDLENIHSGGAFIKALIKIGGLRPWDPGAFGTKDRGEFQSIQQGLAALGYVGVRGPFRNDGLALDDALDQLDRQTWTDLTDDHSIKDKLLRIASGEEAVAWAAGQDLEGAIQTAGVVIGEPWWQDFDGTDFNPADLEGTSISRLFRERAQRAEDADIPSYAEMLRTMADRAEQGLPIAATATDGMALRDLEGQEFVWWPAHTDKPVATIRITENNDAQGDGRYYKAKLLDQLAGWGSEPVMAGLSENPFKDGTVSVSFPVDWLYLRAPEAMSPEAMGPDTSEAETQPARDLAASLRDEMVADEATGGEPEPDVISFRSGNQRAHNDIEGYVGAGKPFGVTAQMTPTVRGLVVQYATAGVPVFVDSGAFGKTRVQDDGTPVVDLDFDAVLDLYEGLIDDIGSGAKLWIVAPDVPPAPVNGRMTSFPRETSALQGQYRDRIGALIDAGANVIVPVQNSADDFVPDMMDAATRFPGALIGLPGNRGAVTVDQLQEALTALTTTHIGEDFRGVHFLGVSEFNRKFQSLVDAVREIYPDAEITTDATRTTAIIGTGRPASEKIAERIQYLAALDADDDVVDYDLSAGLAGQFLNGEWDDFSAEELRQLFAAAGVKEADADAARWDGTLADLFDKAGVEAKFSRDAEGLVQVTGGDTPFIEALWEIAKARRAQVRATKQQARRETITEVESATQTEEDKKRAAIIAKLKALQGEPPPSPAPTAPRGEIVFPSGERGAWPGGVEGERKRLAVYRTEELQADVDRMDPDRLTPDSRAVYDLFVDEIARRTALATGDTLVTGETQTRLPGAEGARQVGRAETPFRAPQQATGEDFDLSSERTEDAAAREAQEEKDKEPGLFQGGELTPTAVEAFVAQTRARHAPDLKLFDVSLTNEGGKPVLRLDHIATQRGTKGVGTAAMADLVMFAEEHGVPITLGLGQKGYQPAEGGKATSSRARLRKFYRGFGFKDNRGRAKDYRLSPYTAMYRLPGSDILFQADEPSAVPDDVLYHADEADDPIPSVNEIMLMVEMIDTYPKDLPFADAVRKFNTSYGEGFAGKLRNAFERAWKARRQEVKRVDEVLPPATRRPVPPPPEPPPPAPPPPAPKPPAPPPPAPPPRRPPPSPPPAPAPPAPPPPSVPEMPAEFKRLENESIRQGKHKDMLVKDLFTREPSYLDWLIREGNSARFKDIARYYTTYRPDYINRQQAQAQQQQAAQATAEATLTPELVETFKTFGIQASTAPNGMILLTGRTHAHKDAIKSFGARGVRGPDGRFAGWHVPPDRVAGLADRLRDSGGHGQRPGLRGASYLRDAELRDLRRRADEWPDTSDLPSNRGDVLSESTAALINRGRSSGIPQFVLDEQAEDVARISHAYKQGKPAFILASEPGSGKTYVLGGAIRELRRQGAKRIIYVTLRKDLISQIKDDLAAFKIGDVQFITYSGVRDLAPAPSDVIIFDEAHSIKNVKEAGGSRVAAMASEWVRQSKFAIYSSATPVENPTELNYLTPTGLFTDPFGEFYKFAGAFGATPQRHTDPNGNVSYTVVWIRTRTSDADAAASREWLRKSGVYTSRKIRLPAGQVDSRNVKVTVSPEHQRQYDLFEQAVSDTDAGEGGPKAKMWVKNFQKRLLEAAKVDHAIEEAKSARERGRFPIIFVETKAERVLDIPALIEAERAWIVAAAAARRMRESPPLRSEYGLPPRGIVQVLERYMNISGKASIEIPPATELIQKAFGADKVAIFTGDPQTEAGATKDLAAWRAGTKPVLVATMAKGGTGLSLHDKVGDHQTTQININMPWKATGLVQVAQRSARYGLKGKAEIEWLFANNIPFDRALARRVGGRMADLGATVHGEALTGAANIENFDFEDELFARQAVEEETRGAPWTAEHVGPALNIPLEQAEALIEWARVMGLDVAELPGIRITKGGEIGEDKIEQPKRPLSQTPEDAEKIAKLKAQLALYREKQAPPAVIAKAEAALRALEQPALLGEVRETETPTPTFDRTDEFRLTNEIATVTPKQNTLFQDEDPSPPAPVFYSRLQRAVETTPMQNATGAKWKGVIGKWAVAKPTPTLGASWPQGISQDELLYTSVDDLEDGKAYSKQEVLEYLAANQLQVVPVIYGGEMPVGPRVPDGAGGLAQATVPGAPPAGWSRIEASSGGKPVRYADYQESGAIADDTYREVFLTVPKDTRPLPAVLTWAQEPDRERNMTSRGGERGMVPSWFAIAAGDRAGETSGYQISAMTRARDGRVVYVLDSDGIWSGNRGVSNGQFKSLDEAKTAAETANAGGVLTQSQMGKRITWRDGHPLYGDVENPLVRLRLNERTTTMPVGDPRARVVEHNPKATRYPWRVRVEGEAEHQRSYATREEAEQSVAESPTFTEQRRGRVLFLEEVQPPSKREQARMPALFVKNWREIAFKWALRFAADHGFDEVAWTTGAMQARRYALEKHVDTIDWHRGEAPPRQQWRYEAETARRIAQVQREIGDGPLTYERLMAADQTLAEDFNEQLFNIADRRVTEEERQIELGNAVFQAARQEAEQQQIAASAESTRVTIHPRSGPAITFRAAPDGTISALSGSSGFDGESLDAVLGKELATQILGEEKGSVSGEGLKVGGEGLKRLYDVDFRNVVNSLPVVKKTGGRVATTTLNIPPPGKGASFSASQGGGGRWFVYRTEGTSHENVGGPYPSAAHAKAQADRLRAAERRTATSDVQAIAVTPELREHVLGGQPLFQEKGRRQAKGMVEFLKTGQALIHALSNPDFSTGVHELSHIARRWLLNPDTPEHLRGGVTYADILTAAKWAGARIGPTSIQWQWIGPDGKRVVAPEEKWARGFERYLYDGIAPTKDLQPLFDKTSRWLRKIYTTLEGSSLDIEVTPAMREVYNRIVMVSTPRVTDPSPGYESIPAGITLERLGDTMRGAVFRGSDGAIWHEEGGQYFRSGARPAAEPVVAPPRSAMQAEVERLRAENDKLRSEGGPFFQGAGQPDTPAFQTWFKDSMVVDAADQPLVVYHGTPASFDTFKPGGGKKPYASGPAMWFTHTREDIHAAHHIGGYKGNFKPGTNIMPVYLSIQAPLRVTNANRREIAARFGMTDGFPRMLTADAVARVKAAGYDGIFLWNGETAEGIPSEFIAFDPAQIKSAIGNRGTFDPEATNILHQDPEEPRGYAVIAKDLTPQEREGRKVTAKASLVRIFKSLPSDADWKDIALAGAIARGFYQRTGQALAHVFGETDMPRFVGVLASLSPQVSIENNLANALRFWVAWDKAKRPTTPSVIRRLADKAVGGKAIKAWTNNLIEVLQHDDPAHVVLSGPKVHSFGRNMLGYLNEFTGDTWMAVFAGKPNTLLKGERNVAGTDPGRRPGYLAFTAKTRRAARQLTEETGELWTVAEVQETIWAWSRSLYVAAKKAGMTAEAYLRAGLHTEEAIGATPAFDTLLTQDPVIRGILAGTKYGPRLETLAGRGPAVGPSSRPARSLRTGAGGEGYAPTRAELRTARRLDVVKAERDAAAAENKRQARLDDADDVLMQDPEDTPDRGGFWERRRARAAKAEADRQPLVTSLDPEVEAAIQQAKGEPKVPWQKELWEKLQELPKLRHHYPEINPSTSMMKALANELLLEQEHAARFGQVAAYNRVAEIIKGLTIGQVDTFARALILPDLLKDIEADLYEGKELPFKYKSAAAVTADLEKVTAVVARVPALQEALAKRAALVDGLTRALVNAKLLKEEVLNDPRYYHRKVMSYVGQEKGLGSRPEVRLRRRGWQRARVGGSDFNTAYHESEFEWMAQAFAELKTNATLKALKSLADLVPRLKPEAKRENERRLGAKLARGLGMDESSPFFPEQGRVMAREALQPYRQRMAIAVRGVLEALRSGNYDAHPRFNGVIDELVDAYNEWKEANKDIPPREREPFDSTHPQWWPLLSELAKSDTDAGMSARGAFKAKGDREKYLKQTLGARYIDATSAESMKQLAPAGYVTWQPTEGRHFFKAMSVDEKVLEAVRAGTRELTEADIRAVKAMGGVKETWIIPDWLAATLDDFNPRSRTTGVLGVVDDFVRGAVAVWKSSVLLGPTRFAKYNINNTTGDIDAAAAFSPGIAAHVANASAFLFRTMYGSGPANTALDAKRQERLTELGVLDTGLSVFELPDINDLPFFKHLPEFRRLAEDDPVTFMRKALTPFTVAGKSLRWAYEGAKKATNYRENILRVAAYDYMLKLVKAGKTVYAASNAKRVDALRADVANARGAAAIQQAQERLAALLARDLIGDYHAVSTATIFGRARLVPFFSFQEINMGRYFRLIANAHREGASPAARVGKVAGMIGRGAVRKGISTLITLGILAAVVNAFLIGVSLWNQLMYPEENDKLRATGRQQMHLIVGHFSDGTPRTLRVEGAFSALLAWMNLQDWPTDLHDLYTGDLTVPDKAADMGKSVLNKAWQSTDPFTKMIYEQATGQKTYPDITSPTPIRDRAEHLASLAALDWLYQDVTGKPAPPDKWQSRLLFYRMDPGEAAYFKIRKRIGEWKAENGIEGSRGGRPNERQNALYYYKRAEQWGDTVASDKWLDRYHELGGTDKSMTISIDDGAPLAVLTAEDQRAFKRDITAKEDTVLGLAEDWYSNIYGVKSIRLKKVR